MFLLGCLLTYFFLKVAKFQGWKKKFHVALLVVCWVEIVGAAGTLVILS